MYFETKYRTAASSILVNINDSSSTPVGMAIEESA
jgi:hypothetical protein